MRKFLPYLFGVIFQFFVVFPPGNLGMGSRANSLADEFVLPLGGKRLTAA
jgi:hypothetical protein